MWAPNFNPLMRPAISTQNAFMGHRVTYNSEYLHYGWLRQNHRTLVFRFVDEEVIEMAGMASR